MICIGIEALSKSFGNDRALQEIDLTIPSGEIVCILGPNGAGKTTLFNVITGHIPKDSGSVEISGKLIEDYSKKDLRRTIAILPQVFSLPDRLKVSEIIALFVSLCDSAKKWADDLIQQLDAGALLQKQFRTLSDGEKRKVGLLVTLLNRTAEVYLFDEPTAGLDPVSRRKSWKVISDLNTAGKSVVFSTHYIEEAEDYCGLVALMNRGKITLRGRPADLIMSNSEGTSVVLEIDDCELTDRVRKALTILGCEVRRNSVVLKFEDPEQLSNVLDLLAGQSVGIRGIFTRRCTLEDVFVKQTGTELQDDPTFPFRG